MKVALVGYGKMGHQIEQIVVARGHQVVLIVDEANAADLRSEKIKRADVAIEFSHPSVGLDNIMACLEAGVAVVSGTTGWLEHYDQVVAKVEATGGAFFYASNYSPAVNMFFEANRRLAELIARAGEGFDVTIQEVHHTQKKDAPSGTAITLAEGILEGFPAKQKWVLGPTTEPSELGIAAVRRSVVPGIHVVEWESSNDVIELKHTAKSRYGFAQGAVLAAEFLCGKRGVFGMKELLGF